MGCFLISSDRLTISLLLTFLRRSLFSLGGYGLNLSFITPATPSGLQVYRRELEFLTNCMPFEHWSQTDLDGYIDSVAGNLTLVYVDKLLIGCFILEVYKKSVELHGITRPDLKELLCPRGAYQVLTTVYTLFFNRIFLDLNKRVVVAKIPPEARGALGFLRRWGFKQINSEGRETVWTLQKDKYLSRLSDKEMERVSGRKETTEGEVGKGIVPV